MEERNCEGLARIVNDWDPVGLLAMNAPKDEYEDEIKVIQQFLGRSGSISVSDLACKIRAVFAQAFGDDVYDRTDEDEVAKKMLKIWQMKNEK